MRARDPGFDDLQFVSNQMAVLLISLSRLHPLLPDVWARGNLGTRFSMFYTAMLYINLVFYYTYYF